MEEKDFKRTLYHFCMALISFVVTMILCVVFSMFSGCRSVKYVPVPEYHTEYRVKTDSFVKKDSVWEKDSVWLWTRGDTVYRERWHTKYNDRYVYRNTADTVLKTDSVGVPYPVERRLGKWEQAKSDYFMPLLCTCAIIFVSLLWLIKRRV